MSTAETDPPLRRLAAVARARADRLSAAGGRAASASSSPLASDAFLTLGNLLNVLRQTALLFLLASGLTLVILTAGLDLSVGANVALSACLAATVIKATGSPALGFATGLGCGALVGFVNGMLVTALRIPSFIATYGMLWVLIGHHLLLHGGRDHSRLPAWRSASSAAAICSASRRRST